MNKEVLPESHKLFKETFQQSWDEISKDVRTKIAKRFFNGDNMKPADLLLKRALEALHGCSPSDAFNLRAEIRAFLAAEPEATPVAWMHPNGGVIQTRLTGLERDTYTIPLYTKPAESVEFLCNATRFKIKGSKAEEMIYGLPQNLIGKWVAFVDADNGQHLKLTKPAELARKPMTHEEIIQGVTVDTSDDFHAGYWAGIRWAERHHGIGGGDE